MKADKLLSETTRIRNWTITNISDGTEVGQLTIELATGGALATALVVDVGIIDLGSISGGGLLNIANAGSDWDGTSLRTAVDIITADGTQVIVGHTAVLTIDSGTALSACHRLSVENRFRIPYPGIDSRRVFFFRLFSS